MRVASCDESKQPGTPDVGEDSTTWTGSRLICEKKTKWRDALQQEFVGRNGRSLYVELDVGKSIDPTDLIGRRLQVHCPVEDTWMYGTPMEYKEENGMHGLVFDDSSRTEIPLPAFKVRILYFRGEKLPQPPSCKRLSELVKMYEKQIKANVYRSGDVEALQEAIDSMQRLVNGRLDEPAVPMPTFLPGTLVWSKFGKYPHWPAVIMTKDQILREPVCNKEKAEEEHVAVYYFGTYEHYLSPKSLVVDFVQGLEKDMEKMKKKMKTFMTAIDEAEAYLKVCG